MASERWGNARPKILLERKHKNVEDLLAALKVCSRTRDLEKGKQIHAEAVKCRHVYVANALINMYAKCGSMLDACQLFEGLKHPTVVSWNILILGYAENGQGHIALALFTKMRNEGLSPNFVTFVAAIKACIFQDGAAECREERGKEVHNIAVQCGYHSDAYVQSTLIQMYAKVGSIAHAQEVFDSTDDPSVVSWNVLILGYLDNGQDRTALELFTKMTVPDPVTLVAALKACTSLASKGTSWAGKELHNVAVEGGCNSDMYVQSTLVDMYAKCGCMIDARDVFDSMKYPTVMSWTALILGYSDNGQGHIALDMFARMRIEGPAPDSITLMAALKACTSVAVEGGASRWSESRDRGKQVHNIALENVSNSDVYVQSTLVDMYSKCGSMMQAREVFDSTKHPTLMSWTALILGYADHGQGHTAIEIFTRMRRDGPEADSVTLVAALAACISLAVEEAGRAECKNKGKLIHNIAMENGCNSDGHVQSTLVDMYAKCGSMVHARQVFECMKHPTVVSWTALILGYAENGQAHTALGLFTRMRTEGPSPNSVTFGAALKACGLLGALEFGKTIHLEIGSANPDLVLFTCLVDFYVKCGSFLEAQNVFFLRAETRDVISWNTLLDGFSISGDSEVVFGLFERMQDAGCRPDGITFLSILTCCSHSGLVVKGKECFDTMSIKYGVIPNVKHYTCMIDIFGRGNKLDDAMALLKHMPCCPNAVTWMTILGACRKWGNVEIGRLAFQSLLDLNSMDAPAYVLMGQIYGSRGMLQEQEMVLGLRKKLKAYTGTTGKTCWTNEAGHVHTFVGEDNQHPEIRDKLDSLGAVMRQHGYAFMQHSEKEEALCTHSERSALVCALINTQPRKTIRIVKNLNICKDCHTAIALISILECRIIICRDASRIHVFKNGSCSCGDYW